jgi:hypothetical protein
LQTAKLTPPAVVHHLRYTERAHDIRNLRALRDQNVRPSQLRDDLLRLVVPLTISVLLGQKSILRVGPIQWGGSTGSTLKVLYKPYKLAELASALRELLQT